MQGPLGCVPWEWSCDQHHPGWVLKIAPTSPYYFPFSFYFSCLPHCPRIIPSFWCSRVPWGGGGDRLLFSGLSLGFVVVATQQILSHLQHLPELLLLSPLSWTAILSALPSVLPLQWVPTSCCLAILASVLVQVFLLDLDSGV